MMSLRDQTDRIKDTLIRGVHDRIYPGAVLLVAFRNNILFFQAVGHCSSTPPAALVTCDTIFDLASLTKPLATSLALMKCVDDNIIDLDQPLGSLLHKALPKDKTTITPRLLLTHSAGFADWKPFYLKLVDFAPEKRKPLLRKWIMEIPLAYAPGTGTRYSDLGYMILEWVVEECTKMRFHEFVYRSFFSPLSMTKIYFSGTTLPRHQNKHQIAATEDCPWRKMVMHGTVHDENAYAIGGYSGHAGLFGNANSVYVLADLLKSHYAGKRNDYFRPETVRTFFTRQNFVKGGTYALGWDTPSPDNSSSGKYFSKNTVGHLGYTGTSIWMDLEKDLIVVFLSNRVHPSRNNEKIREFRPFLHDLIMEEMHLNG